MTARQDNYDIIRAANGRGFDLSLDDANTLRRAEKTLHRWAEQECGWRNDYGSGCLVRNDDGSTWIEFHFYRPDRYEARPIPDREKGALKRIHALCERLGIFYHHQTDPRGCALYVSNEPLTDSDYPKGIACCR